MKLSCLKSKLREIINISEKVAGKNLSLPVLSTTLIRAQKNLLIVKATNLDVGLEVEIPIKVEEDGEVAVKAAVLSNYLNNIYGDDRITLETKNGNLKVTSSNTSSIIKCLSTDDFPVIPKITNRNKFVINSKDLTIGFRSVLFASALTDIKPEISSVYVYQDHNELIFVATDGFRLAEKRIMIKGKDQEISSIIIPYKNVAEIVRVFENLDEGVWIETDKNQASFYTENVHLASRVIDGIYPDYKQIMPTHFNTEVTAGKDDLANAFKLSNIFSDKFNQITIKVSPASQSLMISSQNQEVGENQVAVVGVVRGEDKTMVFNARYILDCFPVLSSSKVVIGFNDSHKPIMVASSDNKSFHYIIMPVVQ